MRVFGFQKRGRKQKRLSRSAGGMTSSASAEEYRGTWEQQAACTPDVWRLCSDQIADIGRIVACLQRKNDLLSNSRRPVLPIGR